MSWCPSVMQTASLQAQDSPNTTFSSVRVACPRCWPHVVAVFT